MRTAVPRRLLAAAIVLCLATGLGVSLSLGHTVQRKDLSVHQVVAQYYADLRRHDASAAFSLLCPGQQTRGVDAFGQDVTSAVDVKSWQQHGKDQRGASGGRGVSGTITLGDGFVAQIVVVLAHTDVGWSVCGTLPFGGVLPYSKGSAPGGANV